MHHYACEACRFEIVPFWIISECPRERAYDETSGSDPVKILAAQPRCSPLHHFGSAVGEQRSYAAKISSESEPDVLS
jgi:hypothetical protein